MRNSLLLVVFWVLPLTASAVNRCTDPSGKVIFQDRPGPPGSTSFQSRQSGAAKAVQTPAEVAAEFEKQLNEKIKARTAPMPIQVPPSAFRPESSSRALDFASCTKLMIQNISIYGANNTRVVVSTGDMKMQRICTTDGSVVVTCSRLDHSMVTTKSAERC